MRTITLTAHSRPEYVAKSISALAGALVACERDSPFDLLLISIDPGNDEVTEVCNRGGEMLAECGLIDCEVYVNSLRFSCAGNSMVSLQRAFEGKGSDFNLAIEDDAVLSPDALLLADWFYRNHSLPTSRYGLMSMCNHNKLNCLGPLGTDPSVLVEWTYLTSPFAWCMSKWQWPLVKATWDMRTRPPSGWDWSLSMTLALCARRTLFPPLSRCKNIGRDGGTNETPESFDRTQTGLKYSDGSYRGEYCISLPVPESVMRRNVELAAQDRHIFKMGAA